MRVIDDSVHNRVGDSGLSNDFMPERYRNLAGNNLQAWNPKAVAKKLFPVSPTQGGRNYVTGKIIVARGKK